MHAGDGLELVGQPAVDLLLIPLEEIVGQLAAGLRLHRVADRPARQAGEAMADLLRRDLVAEFGKRR